MQTQLRDGRGTTRWLWAVSAAVAVALGMSIVAIYVGGAPAGAETLLVQAPETKPAQPSQPPPVPQPSVPQPLIERLRGEARELSFTPFKPVEESKAPITTATYDTYRKIRFQPKRAVWHRQPLGLELHPLPLGWLFKRPIELSVVEDGLVRPLKFTGADFLDEREGAMDDQLRTAEMPLSGFRISGPLNGIDKPDEIIVFQGASYFRALGRGHAYGLSARGLAIGTASIKGEEFPTFRKFWIERPEDSTSIVIHALLDSESTTGLYTFTVRPGAETMVDVSAVLYPRREITEIGIAPLTSMFLVAPSNPTRVQDFRPRVHDSDGLAILNGWGERIWRPLANPRKLQVSSFLDENPRGFGLIQRNRRFADYQDLEARYERRPSLWVDLDRGLGAGSIMLVEIPTEEEIHDNIVAFWRPVKALEKGREHRLSYRLRWRDETPTRFVGPWVAETRIGRAYHKDSGGIHVVIDYVDHARFDGTKMPTATASTSHGAVKNVVAQPNPETGGIRVSFVLDPAGSNFAELRVNLSDWNGRVPETWLYRWTGQ